MLDNLRKEVYAKFQLKNTDDSICKRLHEIESKLEDVNERSLHSKSQINQLSDTLNIHAKDILDIQNKLSDLKAQIKQLKEDTDYKLDNMKKLVTDLERTLLDKLLEKADASDLHNQMMALREMIGNMDHSSIPTTVLETTVPVGSGVGSKDINELKNSIKLLQDQFSTHDKTISELKTKTITSM